jgi:hypothetical protein
MRPTVLLATFLFSIEFLGGISADEPKPHVTVIAEGVGTIADEATKDALRNAVRQVVGTVVDAETLIKDDKIISDKVLTYSDGFVKTYKELNQFANKGLIRVRISAEVERRSVVAKLKENKVKVSEVDGKGLFAETVTDLEAAKNAKELLQKALKDFNKSNLSAVVGKPVIVKKTDDGAIVRFDIQIQPNIKAFEASSKKLQELLFKISKDKGYFSTQFGVQRTQDSTTPLDYSNPDLSRLNDALPILMPKAFRKLPETATNRDLYKMGGVLADRAIIAIAAQQSKNAERILYKYYILDAETNAAIIELANSKPKARLLLVDSNTKEIARDDFVLAEEVAAGGYCASLVAPLGIRAKVSLGIYEHVDSTEGIDSPYGYFISPTFLKRNGGGMRHKPSIVITRELKLTLEELKNISGATVSIE